MQTYATADAEDWLQLIRAEYLEMPGLSLTLAQAQRLWCLEPPEAHTFLQTLVQRNFLRKTPEGRFLRAD
jgi:DNA-binding IclR family transcriptional regulator